tara:strand:- start:239 stop:442 length:204 start_codon:yes stop_codon:yes gene_type:complete
MENLKINDIKIVLESLNDVNKLINKQAEELIKSPERHDIKRNLNWNLRTQTTLLNEMLLLTDVKPNR